MTKIGIFLASALLVPALLTAAEPLTALPRWGPPPPAVPVAGAENHLDVVYAPERIVGSEHDTRFKMNIHVPENKGPGPFPVIMVIHGGGYIGGHKDYTHHGSSSPSPESIRQALEKGFVVANINYPTGRSIRNFSWWALPQAVRFLRANAEKYRIDPGRIGAWGNSAGGWISSSVFGSHPEDFSTVPLNTTLPTDTGRSRPGTGISISMRDPRASQQEINARISTINADFWENTKFFQADAPALLAYTGKGARHQIADDAEKGGTDFTALEMDDFAGKNNIHMPKLSTPLVQGGTLHEGIFAWLEDRLITNPRTIPPEATPTRREFIGSVDVRLVAASPDAAIFYTLDGSDPSPESTLYTTPIPLSATTTIRAMATRPGEKTSAPTEFTYTKVDKIFEITGPEEFLLPKAKVGEPYKVKFSTTEDGSVEWNLSGHLQFNKPGNDPRPNDLTGGLYFDHATGSLSGTPTHPGDFLFLILARPAAATAGDARMFQLVIEP